MQPCMTGSYRDDHLFIKKKEEKRRIPHSFGTSNGYLLCCRMQRGRPQGKRRVRVKVRGVFMVNGGEGSVQHHISTHDVTAV